MAEHLSGTLGRLVQQPPAETCSVLRSRTATALMRCLCPLYDTNRRTWIQLQPMSVARSGHGAVAAGQCCFTPQRGPGRTGLTRFCSVRGLSVCHGRS